MKKPVLFFMTLLLLSACGNSQQKQTEAADSTAVESATIIDSTEIMAKDEIVGIINDLYAAEARNEADIDGQFACHAWREMVAAVNEKDMDVEEIGFFNDDYWTVMQDSNPDDLEARDILFEQLDVEKGTAMVSFTLYSSVQTIHQKFAFCREDGDWRIHNIIRFFDDADGNETESDLLQAMTNYLSEPQE